jgi:hypothetical protein
MKPGTPQKPSPTVLIALSSGHMARLHIYSGAVNRLAEAGVRVVLLAPLGKESPLRALTDERVEFAEAVLPRSRVYNRILTPVHNYLFYTMLRTDTNRMKEEAMRVCEPMRYWCIRALGRRRATALRVWNGLRRAFVPGRLYYPVFQKHQPDLVVVGSMARSLSTYYPLRCASLLKVRSICTVQSWDFLTQKDLPLERPDKLVVWNEVSQEEAVTLHGFAPDNVYPTGVPHFDLYFGRHAFPDREAWMRSQGLDPQRRLITVAAQPSLFRPRILEDVVTTLANAIQANRFAEPCQVMVRPHPGVYSGQVPGEGTEADLRRYEAMGPHIHGNRIALAGARISLDTHHSEQTAVADLLYHSDVVLDFFGTMSIEAAALDTPVIYVDFVPAGVRNPAEANKLDFRNFNTFRNIVNLKGVRIADNPEQLVSTIDLYLRNPGLDSVERRRVTERLCYRTDGRSAERLANVMKCYASCIWPPTNQVSDRVTAGAQ